MMSESKLLKRVSIGYNRISDTIILVIDLEKLEFN